jgi:hypothetical protein
MFPYPGKLFPNFGGKPVYPVGLKHACDRVGEAVRIGVEFAARGKVYRWRMIGQPGLDADWLR